MDGNEPFGLFLGAVALLAAFALVRSRGRPRPGAHRWGRTGADAQRHRPARMGEPGHSGNDSSRGPGGTDGGASDNDGAASGRD